MSSRWGLASLDIGRSIKELGLLVLTWPHRAAARANRGAHLLNAELLPKVFFGRDEVGKSSVSASYGDSGSSFVKAAAPSAAPVSLTCLSEHTSPFIPDISKLETTNMMRSRSHVIRRKGRVLGVTRLGINRRVAHQKPGQRRKSDDVCSLNPGFRGRCPARHESASCSAARKPMLSVHGFASRLGLWGVHECCFWGFARSWPKLLERSKHSTNSFKLQTKKLIKLNSFNRCQRMCRVRCGCAVSRKHSREGHDLHVRS